MTTSDSGTWNPESFDRGLTECGTCGTRTTDGAGIDPSSLRRLVHDEIRRYLASGAADEAEPVSPVVEGDGSGGEGCEAPGRFEGLDLDKAQEALAFKVRKGFWTAIVGEMVARHIAEVRRLESEVDSRARSVIAANGRTEMVEAALVRVRGERDEWHAEAITVTNDRDYLRKFLDETVRERDEARAALEVVKECAHSEAVARAEAEAELAALPEKIAAKISEQRSNWVSATFYATVEASAAVARSFASPAEPVPEPVREWGVRHGDDCKHLSLRGLTAFASSEERARASSEKNRCSSVVVSRIPGGEWEAAD